MAEFEIPGPNGKTYVVEAPEGSDAGTIKNRFYKDMGWPLSGGNTTLNQGRVLGTAAVQGATDVANIPSTVMSLAGPLASAQTRVSSWIRELFGAEPLSEDFQKKATEREYEIGGKISRALDVKGGLESAGVPTDPKKEAERLGVPYEGAIEDISRGVRVGTGMLAMGVGRVGSALSAVGAAAGTEAGGRIGSLVGAPETGKDIGEIAGSILAPGAALKVSRDIAARKARPPDVEKLEVMAKDAYKRSSDAGVIVAQPAMGDLARDVATTVAKEGFYGPLHQKTEAAMKLVVEQSKTGVSLEKLDQMRQVVREAMSGASEGDRRLLRLMVSRIDDFAANLAPGNIIAGDAQKGVTSLLEARQLWSRKAKADMIDDLVENARTNASTYTAAGFQKALKDQFKSLSKKQSEMRMFSPDERDAIQAVARGGKVENFLRQVGRLAPQNLLNAAVVGGLVSRVAGFDVAAGVTGAGLLGRIASTAKTTGSLKVLDEMVRRGGTAPIKSLSPLERQLLQTVILRSVNEAATQAAPQAEEQ